jgi:hypothetical protein
MRAFALRFIFRNPALTQVWLLSLPFTALMLRSFFGYGEICFSQPTRLEGRQRSQLPLPTYVQLHPECAQCFCRRVRLGAGSGRWTLDIDRPILLCTQRLRWGVSGTRSYYTDVCGPGGVAMPASAVPIPTGYPAGTLPPVPSKLLRIIRSTDFEPYENLSDAHLGPCYRYLRIQIPIWLLGVPLGLIWIWLIGVAYRQRERSGFLAMVSPTPTPRS